MPGSTQEDLQKRIDTIEESYEFMLAYAAQGLSTDEATRSGAQLRDFLTRMDEALAKLADLFATVVEQDRLAPQGVYGDFVEVLRDDARKARAAVQLTLAQPGISSQLVDNLNASIHLRALLTDVFLLDEIISPRSAASR